MSKIDSGKIVSLALELGADDVVKFSIDQIVFDSRTIIKCMFGCSDWGKGHTCPSRAGFLKPWEFEQILKKYSWGVIIHSHSKKTAQKVSYEIERTVFEQGGYFAFSMSDCALCKECSGFKNKACVNPSKARPAFHSVGIDVFATVRKFDLPIETLTDRDEEQNWYSAVFVE